MSTHNDGSSLADYLAVLRRRKWIVLEAAALVPLVALLLAFNQDRVYSASSDVLLSRENLAAALTGTPDPGQNAPADRLAETQARLARVPDVVEGALARSGVPNRSVREFLDASSVSAQTNADLLEFRVEDEKPALAQLLATNYARAYTEYRTKLDTAAIVEARREVEARIAELRREGRRDSPLLDSLVEKEQQLATMEALRTSNVSVVRPATEAVQVRPRPLRTAILGGAFGLALGIALAFLWNALDTRVRSVEEVGRRLGLPLLARIPQASRRLRSKDRLVMVDEPSSVPAEAFRILRTNLDFARLRGSPRTIMVTSAVEQEGKSTTVANLAIALARGGQRVALVDLDLRRPYLARFFSLDGAWGVTQVALGQVSLEEALTPVSVHPETNGKRGAVSAANGNGRFYGSLHVLPSGPLPPDPGEFVGAGPLDEMIARLREQVDIVLIDAPPLLHVGDAITLSAKVDAAIVVVRLNVVRRRMLEELRRLLASVPTEKLGFVATGAQEEEDTYSYGYDTAYARLPEARGQERVA